VERPGLESLQVSLVLRKSVNQTEWSRCLLEEQKNPSQQVLTTTHPCPLPPHTPVPGAGDSGDLKTLLMEMTF
jgi:hypothetical protein